MTKSIAERLKALERAWCLDPDCGDPDCADCAPYRELASIRAEVEAVAREMREIRAMYGEMVPFDPATGGFDVALQREGQRKAVCRIMNAILNGDWADRLAGGE